MPLVQLPNGAMAFICGGRGGRVKRCTYCGATSSKLCDFKVLKVERGRELVGTCDAPLCARCATPIGEDLDLCRAHVPLWDFEKKIAKVGPGAPAPAGSR